MFCFFDFGLLLKRVAAMMVAIAIVVVLVSPLLASPPTVLRLHRAAETILQITLLAFVSLAVIAADDGRSSWIIRFQSANRSGFRTSSLGLRKRPLLC